MFIMSMQIYSLFVEWEILTRLVLVRSRFINVSSTQPSENEHASRSFRGEEYKMECALRRMNEGHLFHSSCSLLLIVSPNIRCQRTIKPGSIAMYLTFVLSVRIYLLLEGLTIVSLKWSPNKRREKITVEWENKDQNFLLRSVSQARVCFCDVCFDLISWELIRDHIRIWINNYL